MPTSNLPQTTDIEISQIAEELYKRNSELFRERKRFEELLYRISEGIFATDENGTITIFNYTLEKMLGISAENAIGKNVKEIIKLKDNDENDINISAYYNPKLDLDKLQRSAVLITDYRNYYVHIKSSVIETNTEGKEFLVTVSDVTQEKELEKEKDEFISITSHELKTPISIIKSYVWMLENERGGTLNEKQKMYLSKAMKGTDRMINLINDMLKISRMEQGRLSFSFALVDTKEVIQETLDEIKHIIDQKHIELKVNLNEVSPAYTDKSKLIEILMNLISNASKYTDEGYILIELTQSDPNFVKISVKDSGRGITKEETTKLFKKFQRLDNTYETMAKSGGTGLGLYIIKMYMSNLGGSIGVDSEGLGKGSTFWITLPTKKELINAGGTTAKIF